jgi:hypothetical protein
VVDALSPWPGSDAYVSFLAHHIRAASHPSLPVDTRVDGSDDALGGAVLASVLDSILLEPGSCGALAAFVSSFLKARGLESLPLLPLRPASPVERLLDALPRYRGAFGTRPSRLLYLDTLTTGDGPARRTLVEYASHGAPVGLVSLVASDDSGPSPSYRDLGTWLDDYAIAHYPLVSYAAVAPSRSSRITRQPSCVQNEGCPKNQ